MKQKIHNFDIVFNNFFLQETFSAPTILLFLVLYHSLILSLCPLPLPSLHSQLLLWECQHWRHVAFLPFPWERGTESKRDMDRVKKKKAVRPLKWRLIEARAYNQHTYLLTQSAHSHIHTHIHNIYQHTLWPKFIEHKQVCLYICFCPSPLLKTRLNLKLCFLGQRTAEHVSSLLPRNCSSLCNLFPFRAADAVVVHTHTSSRAKRSCCCPVTGAQIG